MYGLMLIGVSVTLPTLFTSARAGRIADTTPPSFKSWSITLSLTQKYSPSQKMMIVDCQHYQYGQLLLYYLWRLTFEDSQVNQRVGASSLNQQHTSMTSVQSAISCTQTEKEKGQWEDRKKKRGMNQYKYLVLLLICCGHVWHAPNINESNFPDGRRQKR